MEIVIAIIGSGIITKLLDAALDWLRERNNPMKVGMRMCLLKHIQDYGKELLEQKYVTQQQLNAFEEAYKAYKDLGGDGFADKIHGEVCGLELKF